MTPLATELFELTPETYARTRKERRAHAIRLRQARRVGLGDMISVEFENADTLRYQAQEMLYVERVTDPIAAAMEVAVYERLLPTATTLTATMFVQIDDQRAVRAELERLDGLHESIRLEAGGHTCRARDIPPPDEGPSKRTVSVHFLAFDLSTDLLSALRRGEAARLIVDHPEYQVEAGLDPQLVRTILTEREQPDEV